MPQSSPQLITRFVILDVSANSSEEQLAFVTCKAICKAYPEEERCEPGVGEKASFVQVQIDHPRRKRKRSRAKWGEVDLSPRAEFSCSILHTFKGENTSKNLINILNFPPKVNIQK